MSSTHARLIRVGRSWAVEDLGSKNGTFVDGQRVSRTVVAPGSTIEVGHTFIQVRSIALPADAPRTREVQGTDYGTVDDSFACELERAVRLVRAGLPAILAGDSGTGKEVLARHLHAQMDRPGSFVALNCGAIPASLVESQLFGHVKGAFSGAVGDEPGFIRAADRGTLFLDEIADLPKASQAALLRVLQEREVVAVGSTRATAVDVRILSATHQSLEQMVEDGAFREDLFARLAGCVIELPRLRNRLEDMGILVAALLRKVARNEGDTVSFTPDVGRALLSYEWPMNVRELEQCLMRCVALSDDGVVTPAMLPPNVARVLNGPRLRAATSIPPLSEEEERLRLDLLSRLSRHHGNVATVARGMGKARSQIHRWCKRFSLDPRVFRI